MSCNCTALPSVHSLAPERFEWKFRQVIFKLFSVNDGWSIPREIALRWMTLDFTDDKSTSVQVMAWCRQATSHYMSWCWPRFMLWYGVTRAKWVNEKGPWSQFLIPTCLLRVTAFGWHLVQIPSGHGGWLVQPALIFTLMFSNWANLPLKNT